MSTSVRALTRDKSRVLVTDSFRESGRMSIKDLVRKSIRASNRALVRDSIVRILEIV